MNYILEWGIYYYYKYSHPNDYAHIIDFYHYNELPADLKYIFVFEISECIFINIYLLNSWIKRIYTY